MGSRLQARGADHRGGQIAVRLRIHNTCPKHQRPRLPERVGDTFRQHGRKKALSRCNKAKKATEPYILKSIEKVPAPI